MKSASLEYLFIKESKKQIDKIKEKVTRKEFLEILSEDKLDEVVGGISFKGIRNGLIVGTSALLGGAIGNGSGAIIGYGASLLSGRFPVKYNETTNEFEENESFCMITGASMLVGKLSGAAVGAAVGQKIVDYLDSW